MPTIFKILVFLFLQQGGRIAKNISVPGNGTAINWETVLLSRPMTLQVQADEMSVNELISLCTLLDMGCEIKTETLGDGRTKAELFFKNLAFTDRTRIMERINPVLIRGVQFQWVEL